MFSADRLPRAFDRNHANSPGIPLAGKGEPNLMPVLMKSVRVQGIFVGSREMLESLSRFVEVNAIKPVVDKVFDFTEVPQAYEYLAQGKHFGKVVVQMG